MLIKDVYITVKQSISNTILRLSNYLKKSLVVIAAFVYLSSSAVSYANDTSTYGPTKKGESLWLITKRLNNKSVSIHQLTLAIFQSNPKSFASGNINLLKAGTVLNIPNNETITKTSSKDAIKKLRQQEHKLKLFQVSNAQLRSARSNVKKQKSNVNKLQKRLGKYKHKSRKWNKTYRQLVLSKRSHNKAKRKVTSLRKLLREKAQLKNQQQLAKQKTHTKKATPTPITLKQESTTTVPAETSAAVVASIKKRSTTKKSKIDKVDKRLGSIQNSLKVIGKSNTLLMTKIIKLSSLNERVQVLEKELGNNDKLVMDLKQSLETAQAMMKQQSQNNANLLKSFDNFEVTLNKPKPVSVIVAKSTNNTETVLSENQKPDVTPTSTKEPMKESIEGGIIASTTEEAVAKTDIREQLMNQLLSEPKQAPIDVAKEVDKDQNVNQTQTIVEAEGVKEETTDIIVDTETLTINLSETKQLESIENIIKEEPKAITEGVITPVEALVVEDTVKPVQTQVIEDTVTTPVKTQVIEDAVMPVETQVVENSVTPVEAQVVLNPSTTKEALVANNSYDAYTKNDLKEVSLLSSKKNTALPSANNSTETAKATLTGLTSETLSMLPTKPSNAAINHQRKLNNSANESGNYWINLLKEQWIVVGSTLNAFILFFVLFKLFSKRKKRQENSENGSDAYISWQDREKPRHA